MTRYLLDTHIWLWFAVSPERLLETVRHELLSPDNEAWVSVASVWELAIKVSIGKIALPDTVDQFVAAYGEAAGFPLLSINAHHASAVATLPRHHNDPFDRLLVCQAMTQGMTLVTADTQIRLYALPILWAGS
jgi:PIN domain nuclease of toxin-antitoxin system